MAFLERTCLLTLCCVALVACEDQHGTVPYGSVDGTALDEPSENELAQQTDGTMRATDPSLFALASSYFAGTTPASAPTRLARLTRSQLDLTVQALLPEAYAGTSLTAMPRDPLQTNYEYAENLSFNAANFTPYTD